MAVKASDDTTPPFPDCESPSPSAGEVTAALDLILAGDAFAKVERPSRFLRHLVECALRGEHILLKETLLGIEVFGREPSWDTRLDPIVRQEAARLRKRLARYYETASPEVRIELPVGTYVPVFRRVASPVDQAIVPAPNDSAPPMPEPVRKPRRYLWAACAAMLLLVLGLIGASRFLTTPGASPPPSIVVLPFTNLSADPANEFLASSFTGEISDELVRMNSMRVIARTSAHAFKSGSDNVREVGRQLNVSYVLEGSVERSGDEIRISAHLERTSDGVRVWYQTYDRPAKDLSSVESELTAAVARSLQAISGRPAEPRHIPTAEAHELLMRGLFEMDKSTPESIARGEQDLQRAVQIDPDYAHAWELLGLARQIMSTARGLSPTAVERSESKEFFRKSLELDPDLSLGHANLAATAMTDWDWAAAEDELRLASRTEKNASVECYYGLLSAYRGRFREADLHMGVAYSLDPLNSGLLLDLVEVRYMEGRIQDAVAISTKALERYPDHILLHLLLNLSYIQEGQTERAVANLRRLETRYPAERIFEVMALGRSGHREDGLRMIRRLEIEYEGDAPVYRFWFALAWAYLGDHTHTLKSLERSADLREIAILSAGVIPNFADMHNDPGFRALQKRIGLP